MSEIDPRVRRLVDLRMWLAIAAAFVVSIGSILIHDWTADAHTSEGGRGVPVFRRVRFFNASSVSVHEIKIFDAGTELVDATVPGTDPGHANSRDANENGFQDEHGLFHANLTTVEFEIVLDENDDSMGDTVLVVQSASAMTGHSLGGIVVCLEDHATDGSWHVTAAGFGQSDDGDALVMNPAAPTRQVIGEQP